MTMKSLGRSVWNSISEELEHRKEGNFTKMQDHVAERLNPGTWVTGII